MSLRYTLKIGLEIRAYTRNRISQLFSSVVKIPDTQGGAKPESKEKEKNKTPKLKQFPQIKVNTETKNCI